MLVSDAASFSVFNSSSLLVRHLVHPAHLSLVPILELNCFVHSDDPRQVFPVKIASTESVGSLKDTIKEKKKPIFDDFAVDTLKLWKVSIAVNDGFMDSVGKVELRDEEELSPVDTVSDIFFEELGRKHLHIIVHSLPASKCISQGV
jgi:hypothetical protein